MVNKKKQKSIDFDFTKDNVFSAIIKLGPNVPEQTFDDVEISTLDHVGGLTFDDVMFKVDAAIEEKFPLKSFPDLKVVEYLVLCSETDKWCPVVSESDKDAIRKLKKSKDKDRYLVLPDAIYHLTPEAELWMTLKDQGLCSEEDEFDFDKMHQILETANKISNKIK